LSLADPEGFEQRWISQQKIGIGNTQALKKRHGRLFRKQLHHLVKMRRRDSPIFS
jgi:hypothetical protein